MPDVEAALEDSKPAFNDVVKLAKEMKRQINLHIGELNKNEKVQRNWITAAKEIHWVTPPLEHRGGQREVLYLDVDGKPGTAYVTEDIEGDVTAVEVADGW
jgi:hypothetical protein